jgi:hypothetical protein
VIGHDLENLDHRPRVLDGLFEHLLHRAVELDELEGQRVGGAQLARQDARGFHARTLHDVTSFRGEKLRPFPCLRNICSSRRGSRPAARAPRTRASARTRSVRHRVSGRAGRCEKGLPCGRCCRRGSAAGRCTSVCRKPPRAPDRSARPILHGQELALRDEEGAAGNVAGRLMVMRHLPRNG